MPSSLVPRSATILLIEEDAAVRFMMREIARALDIKVETARSCREGLIWLRQHPRQFALIILNLQLCGKGTDDTVNSIRADDQAEVRDIPIVGVTEDRFFPNDTTASRARVDAFLHKPVTPAELLSLMDRYVPPAAVNS